MRHHNLPNILIFSRIAAAFIVIGIILSPFLLISAIISSSRQVLSPSAAAEIVAFKEFDVSTIDHAYSVVDDEGKKHAVVLVCDDGHEIPHFGTLSSLVKPGMFKINNGTAVNPSKSCYYKKNGKRYIRTPLTNFRITNWYWTVNCPIPKCQCFPAPA